MRVRYVALFFVSIVLVWSALPPLTQASSLFNISRTKFISLPFIPNTYGVPYQTALRAGDSPMLQVGVRSAYIAEYSVSVDLSQLGISDSSVLPVWRSSPDADSTYFYHIGPFTIGPDISDGIKTVFATAIDTDGRIATSTAHITVDNVKPIISLSSVTFATTSLQGGDYVFVSGIVDGTGSAVAPARASVTLLNANYQQIDVFGSTQYILDLAAAFASSTDGHFSNAPLLLFKIGTPDEVTTATYLKIDTSVYDEAGNVATSSLTVALPKPVPPDPCVALGNCASNVLFLPGIESSRLYRPDYNLGTDQLWEPNIDGDVQDLYMNPDGTSVRNDVYTKKRDVIDELPSGANIYKSFIAKMDDLKTSGTIRDWEPIAYDWRLSLDDILNYGNDVQGRIYYSGDLRATSTPYVIQELRRLAGASKTGKVTIVAHSNGGLLAKRLTELLGPTESARLIDKMIFVAVPQAGTPMAIPAGLHGYKQDHVLGIVTSKSTARTFAKNSPMEYQLLPSASYFTYVDDPVVTFDASLTDWISRYGATIHSQSSLRTFLTDTYGRVDAQTGDINQPIQFSSSLLTGAETLHASLDNWTAPAGVDVIQIAGWGVPKTVGGITYKKKGTWVTPEANFTIDGDGTVVVPSALWTSTTTGATNYWVDLKSYNTLANRILGLRLKTGHASILEVPELLTFIADDLLSHSIDSLPQYISTSIPPSDPHDIRLRYALHSPLTLNLYDNEGRHTGVSTTTGQIEEQIPGTYYAEFGDVKYIFSDADTSASVIMNGYDTGTFTFNVDQYSGDTVTASTTFKDIPTTASTAVSLDVQSDISTLSPMQIDEDGDGIIDVTLSPRLNDIVTLDTTPPELQLTFSTSTRSIAFIGTDDSGTVVITSTTTYPVLKKNQKEKEERERKGIATTTVTVTDEAGNTTALVYTEQLPSPEKRDTITLRALSYGSTGSPQVTSLLQAVVSYKWRINKNGSFNIFASNLRNASTTLESHYRPKKNKTLIMTKPQELDDREEDDDADMRPTRQTLPGMVIPYIVTKDRNLIINY